MTQRLFITGTDTEIGKTFVTGRLAADYRAQGTSVACSKPLASGADKIDGEWVNDDARRLQQAASRTWPIRRINPYCFEPAIAPHIAAQEAGVRIDMDVIRQSIETLEADITLIEGFGGWLAPVAMQDGQTLWQADIARAVKAEVILVVGMRLGCLNHALLSARQIERDGLTLHGWIANRIDPAMPYASDNLDTLERLLGAAPMRIVDWEGGE